MIILAKAKRKKDGSIDLDAQADLRAVRDIDVREITREGDGDVLVRFDDDSPGEYFDAASIDGETILGGKLHDALMKQEAADNQTKKPGKSSESWPKHYR